MTNYFVIDIESAPLPAEVLSEILPEFEADKRLKDEDKIKADLQKKFDDWKDECALHAHRGQIVAIGLINNGVTVILHGVEEKDMLQLLRDYATEWNDKTVVGHNLLSFDIPYIVRRFWHHGIKPPTQWLDCTPWRATWAFDTMLVWSCGNRDQRISLDNLAWHLGVGRKTKDMTGKQFAEIYATDKEKALDYLRNDLKLTEGCYLKMTKP